MSSLMCRGIEPQLRLCQQQSYWRYFSDLENLCCAGESSNCCSDLQGNLILHISFLKMSVMVAYCTWRHNSTYLGGFVHFSESKCKRFLRNFLLQHEEFKCADSVITFVILIQSLCACVFWYIFNSMSCFSLQGYCFTHSTCQIMLSKCDGNSFMYFFFFNLLHYHVAAYLSEHSRILILGSLFPAVVFCITLP